MSKLPAGIEFVFNNNGFGGSESGCGSATIVSPGVTASVEAWVGISEGKTLVTLAVALVTAAGCGSGSTAAGALVSTLRDLAKGGSLYGLGVAANRRGGGPSWAR